MDDFSWFEVVAVGYDAPAIAVVVTPLYGGTNWVFQLNMVEGGLPQVGELIVHDKFREAMYLSPRARAAAVKVWGEMHYRRIPSDLDLYIN